MAMRPASKPGDARRRPHDLSAEFFPDRVGGARRPTSADLLAVVHACYSGWRTSVLRGRYGRLQASFPLLVGGVCLASYAVAPDGITAPTGWFGLSLAAWIVFGTIAWLVAVALQPGVTALLMVRQARSAASYVLDGAPGEPAVLSAIRLRRVRRGLLVENHTAVQPGRGWGRRLRAEVGPHLREVCDMHGWTLLAVAVNTSMAEVYCAEFDGMVRGERTWMNRLAGAYPLERRPQPSRVGPIAPRSPT